MEEGCRYVTRSGHVTSPVAAFYAGEIFRFKGNIQLYGYSTTVTWEEDGTCVDGVRDYPYDLIQVVTAEEPPPKDPEAGDWIWLQGHRRRVHLVRKGGLVLHPLQGGEKYEYVPRKALHAKVKV